MGFFSNCIEGFKVAAIYIGRRFRVLQVTKCESQIEASWTALEAWKSGNKVT
uniref:Uncharacterized protein n=1 Tax=Helianthus annuus TaxID=4232 RepID=A0A251VRQ9_HELAN